MIFFFKYEHFGLVDLRYYTLPVCMKNSSSGFCMNLYFEFSNEM